MSKLVIVADTNILVSSLFWNGNPYRVVQKGTDNQILIFVSEDIISELKRVLKRDFELGEQEIEDIIDTLMLFLRLTKPSEKIDVIKEDEKDNIIIECAVSCDADYIVSGDRHLLNLKSYKNIKIVSAKEFLGISGSD